MNTVLAVLLFVVALPLAHSLWVLAYALSPRRNLDQRLRTFAGRK